MLRNVDAINQTQKTNKWIRTVRENVLRIEYLYRNRNL